MLHRRLGALCLALLLGSFGWPLFPSVASALEPNQKQTPPAAKPKQTAPAAKSKAAAADEEKLPEAEDIDLTTRDGVALRATYWASLKGKDAVPVILLHAWKGNRGEFLALAQYLQSVGHGEDGKGGCAVIAPDLRGHGDSKTIRRGGETDKIEAASLKPADLAAMFAQGGDVEQVKSFLLKENNAGKLNIEKLCVVGVEMGASIAINWAAVDWSWPQLSTLKQGQDVKALVMVSPEQPFKGLPMSHAMQHPAVQKELSILIIAGRNNSKAMQQASRLHKQFERFHPEPNKDEAAEKQDLFLDTPKTSLQGTKLLNEKTAKLHEHIAEFIDLRLVKQRYPWSERNNPLGN